MPANPTILDDDDEVRDLIEWLSVNEGLVVVVCQDCFVLPTVCNCTEEGLPYCGRPDCDIDWCWYCGEEYTDPCPRHEEVGRP